MKTLLTGAVLLLASCATTTLVTIQGVNERVFGRVIERHDLYADMYEDAAALSDSADLRQALGSGPMEAAELRLLADPVLDRHDTYIRTDMLLDTVVERPIYLAATARIRSYLDTVAR